MRKIHALLVLLLFAAVVRADFSDLSLAVTIKVYTNGSAHVTEMVKLAMDQNSMDVYNKSIYLRELTIMDWQQLTKSMYLRQHIFSPLPKKNMKVVPQNIIPYSYGTQSTATIRLEYDLDNIVLLNYTGPRTITYSFNNSVFSFESSPSGQVLPSNNEFTIIIPPDSLVTGISPDPDSPPIQRDYQEGVKGLSNFTWRGAIPLTDFKLEYVREEPMDVEVKAFFEGIESTLIHFMLSAPGIILTLLVFLAVAYLVLTSKR